MGHNAIGYEGGCALAKCLGEARFYEIRLKCVIRHEIYLFAFEISKLFVTIPLFFKEENTTLRVLDLQWNHIRKESAAALCKCLSVRNVFRHCQRYHL